MHNSVLPKWECPVNEDKTCSMGLGTDDGRNLVEIIEMRHLDEGLFLAS